MNQSEKNIIQEHVADNYQRLREKLEAELAAGNEARKKYHAANNADLFKAQGFANLAIKRNIQELQALENNARKMIKSQDNRGLHPSLVAWVKANDIAGTGCGFRAGKTLSYIRQFHYDKIDEAIRKDIFSDFQFLERYWNRPKSLSRLEAHMEALGLVANISRFAERGKHYARLQFSSYEVACEAEDWLSRLGWRSNWLGNNLQHGKLFLQVTPAGKEALEKS